MRTFLPLLSLALVSCAAPPHVSADAEAIRARGDAARARYWAIQAAHEPLPAPATEWLEIPLPERIENGVILTPSTEYIRVRTSR